MQTKLENAIKLMEVFRFTSTKESASYVMYDIDGVTLHHSVIPRHTISAANYCTFLQHHLRPALRRKRRHLVVQNSIILHDNSKSRTVPVTDLLLRWQWEILKHPPYSPDESMRLRSLRQSERTTAWDPVRHKR